MSGKSDNKRSSPRKSEAASSQSQTPSATTSESKDSASAEGKSKSNADILKLEKKISQPAWFEKYRVSLDINARYDIPQVNLSIIPKDMTLEQADNCFEKKCDWISLR